jgi:hypothetical protein
MTEQHEWRIVATYPRPEAIDDEQAAQLLAGLPGFGVLHHDDARLTVQATVQAPTIRTAAEVGLRAVRQAWAATWGRPADPIGVRVLTLEEYERELARPYGLDLVGLKEIAEILRVSKQRAADVAELPDFPPPVGTPAAGPMFTRESVVEFEKRWERKPGRPRKT